MSTVKHLVFPSSSTDRAGDVGLLLLRLALGAIFVAHGAGKLFGIFGGDGIDGTAAFFAQNGLKPSEPLAVLAGTGELVGGLLLAMGLVSRLGALLVAVPMVIAIVAVDLPGPFVNGYEFPLALLAAAIAVLLVGPGRISVDGVLGRRS